MSLKAMSQGSNPFRNLADGHSQTRESDPKYENSHNLIELSEWERILDIASGAVTMSEGGHPFRTRADGYSQQESESKYEERLAYIEWERILKKASRDRCFDPPSKMKVCTPLTLPNSSARKHGGRDLDDAFCCEDQYEARDHYLQHDHHHNGRHRKHRHHHHRQHHHNGQHREHHHYREVHHHSAPNFDQEYMNDLLRLDIDSYDATSYRIAHPGSRSCTTDLSIPKLVIPKPTSLTDNPYGRFQSTRQWCEDDESPSDVNRWSSKRLMCGVQVNEVECVTPAFSTIQFPPKRERRPYSGLHSLSSQDERKTSFYHKIHSPETPDDSRRSLPLGFISHSMNRWSPKRLMCGMQVAPELLTKPSPPKREGCPYSSFHSFSAADQKKTLPHHKSHLQKRLDDFFLLGFLSHSMNLYREEKPAKPARSVQRREWYERSDSMKGKEVSDHPHFMLMVFFETVGEDPPKEDSGQPCTA